MAPNIHKIKQLKLSLLMTHELRRERLKANGIKVTCNSLVGNRRAETGIRKQAEKAKLNI